MDSVESVKCIWKVFLTCTFNFMAFFQGSGSGFFANWIRTREKSPIRIRTKGPGSETLPCCQVVGAHYPGATGRTFLFNFCKPSRNPRHTNGEGDFISSDVTTCACSQNGEIAGWANAPLLLLHACRPEFLSFPPFTTPLKGQSHEIKVSFFRA